MRRLLLAAAFCASLLSACSARSSRPDILLITIDTLRADRLGCYGYAGVRTPHIDALAREGVRYVQCQAPTPITLPSHASILTGKLPPRHGVRNNATYRLPEEIPSLPQALREAGYTTGAFVAALPLDSSSGLDRGFDHYDDTLGESAPELFTLRERPASQVLRSALDWLRGRDAKTPVFLWVHFFEPHAPYLPPAPFDQEYRSAPYDGEVAAVDAAVGQLVDAFAATRGRERITVLTSDHGEGLGEHGEATHAIFLYQSTLRVPLILHAPGIWPAGSVVEEPVGLIDLAPTILGALDLSPAALDPDGIALTPQASPPARRVFYSESLYALEAYRWSPLFALREGGRKVIRSRISHAYDLDRDPGETQNLLSDELDWGEPLLRSLDQRVVELSVTAQRLDAERQPTPEESEALAALGYVGGVREATGPRDDDKLLRLTTELPDASERQGEFDRTHEAEQLIRQRDFAGAISVLEAVLASSPQNVWARMLYAQALGEAGRTDEAIAAYESAASLRPDWLEIHTNLARLQIRKDDVAAATRHFDRALAIDPENVELRIEAAAFLQAKQRFEAGMLLLERGFELVTDPLARARLEGAAARFAYQLGDLPRGRAHLERARALRDDASLRTLAALYLRAERRWQEIVTLLTPELAQADGETQQVYGEALQRLGRNEEAVAVYRRAIGLADSLHLAHNNLAWALATELDRAEEALAHAQRAIALKPDSADYHDTYLEVLERLGRTEEARAHLRLILPQFGSDAALRTRAERLK